MHNKDQNPVRPNSFQTRAETKTARANRQIKRVRDHNAWKKRLVFRTRKRGNQCNGPDDKNDQFGNPGSDPKTGMSINIGEGHRHKETRRETVSRPLRKTMNELMNNAMNVSNRKRGSRSEWQAKSPPTASSAEQQADQAKAQPANRAGSQAQGSRRIPMKRQIIQTMDTRGVKIEEMQPGPLNYAGYCRGV